MSLEQTKQRYCVLGAAGAMGALFARELRRCGHHVTGFDLRSPDGAASEFDAFVTDDALKPSAASLEAWAASDGVIVCLPHAPSLAAIEVAARAAGEDRLVVDTHSVKTPVVRLLDALPGGAVRCQYLSINPMFAPSLGFAGQKVVAVACRPGERASAFVRLMEGWGATVETLSADQHDRAAAVMQVATHLVLICLGRAVRDAGVDVRDLLRIAPPPHLMSLAMLSRIVTAAPETYWDIQRDNPYGGELRGHVFAAVAEIDAMVSAGDEAGFADTLSSIRRTLEPVLGTLSKAGTAAIRAAVGELMAEAENRG